MCDLILRASDDFNALTRIEKARYRFGMMGCLRRYEAAYFHHNGIINIMFTLPGSRAVWELISNRFSVDFRTYVDALIKRVPTEQQSAEAPAS